ncbi:MAG: M14-type cytosolic carboxypeptidase [Verrucomicrobiota bacterium]|nr:M14-type cytosolic carboxypeptidase [Verrucomicrobiota bacterium]
MKKANPVPHPGQAARRCASTLALIFVAFSAPATITVSTDFEGGSATIEALDPAAQTIRLRPAGDPARGWPCWWYLRVDGLAPGSELQVEVLAAAGKIPQTGPYLGRPLPASWSQPVRAAWSTDGRAWRHTAPGEKRAEAMVYRCTAATESVWLAWGPPFTPRDSAEMCNALAARHPAAKPFELCKSREGRPCPALRVREGDKPEAARFGVWVQARQHAWESGSSWVARGLAEWLISDGPGAAWVRQNAEVSVVPIMDIDNTAAGHGGKEALPRDHNRDWSELPHWNEVSAAQTAIKSLAVQGRMDVFMDLHNPGPSDRNVSFWIPPRDLLTEPARRNLDRWLAIAPHVFNGPIPLAPKPRETGPKYHPLWKQISKQWVVSHGNPHTLAFTVETGWNTPGSHTDGYLAVGRQLGEALERYLRENPRNFEAGK